MAQLLANFPLTTPLTEENLEKASVIVSTAIDGLRAEVFRDIKGKFGNNVSKWNADAEKIAKDVRNQSKQIEENTDRVKKLLSEWTDTWNIDKVKEIRKELASTNHRMKKLRSIVDTYETLESLDSAEKHQKRDYVKRAELLSKLDDRLSSVAVTAKPSKKRRPSVVDGTSEFDVSASMMKALKEELIVRKEGFICDLYEEWGESFRWDIDKENSNRFVATVGQKFQEVVLSLEGIALLEKKMDHLGKCVMNWLLVPLLNEHGSQLKPIVDGKDPTVEIIVSKSTDGPKQSRDLAEVLDEVFKIFSALNGKLDVSLKSGDKFTRSLLEGFILKPLKEFLVESVLKPVVPSDASDMPKFGRLLASCNNFFQRMKQAGLISDKEPSLVEFASSVDTLFLAKRCQTILGRARQLITAELHATAQVGGKATTSDDAKMCAKCLGSIPSQKNEKETTPPRLDFDKPLPPLSELPLCHVSESVVSLRELVIKTLDESANSSKPLAASRLYYCARNMIELYLDLCPARHGDQLKTVPQITAVFYNNCYYLCHHLLTLGLTYESKLLPVIAVPSGVITITFVDFIPRLKEMANEAMDAQVQMQIRYLIDCLKPAGGFAHASEVKKVSVYQKAVKACSLQFQHVSRVWRQVLSATMFLKLEGKLAEELLVYMVKAIVRLEDIAADDAKVLYEMLKEFLKDMEGCFLVDKTSYIHRFCESGYFKSKELIFVLNASLAEIEDRWAAGNGPLADHMEATEVKQLIRALFQNTDRRAALLAKIK